MTLKSLCVEQNIYIAFLTIDSVTIRRLSETTITCMSSFFTCEGQTQKNIVFGIMGQILFREF